MWIRNQNKDRIVKVSDIKWEYDNKSEEYTIVGLNDNWVRLGEYLTREDAMKIFDDIEKILHMRDSPM